MTKATKTPPLQQQVLFEEDNVALPVSTAPQTQIIVDEQAFEQEQIDSFYQEDTRELIDKRSKSSWLTSSIVMVLAVLIGYELADFFINGWQNSPIITSIYGVLLLLVSVLAGGALWREAKQLTQLKRQQQLQTWLQQEQQIETEQLIKSFEQITQSLAIDITPEMEQQWQQVTKQSLQTREVVDAYQQIFLQQADQKAADIIAKYATEATVLVAMSPIALLDMMLLLWRNLHMMEQIASQYGVTLGYWSRIKLLKQLVKNLVYAGASELIADLGINLLNMELLGKFSTRLAQGFGAGMLTTRLGIHTLKLCRPIALAEQNKPWQGIHRRMIKQIKQLIFKNNDN